MRGGSSDGAEGLLQKKELEAVMASLHQPNYVIQIMSVIIQNCSLSGMEEVSMDLNITQNFHDHLGICEQAPIPFLHKVDIEVPGHLAHCTAFSFLGSMLLDCYPCYFT